LIVAAAFALGASSVALADDSSMNPINGDSYKYFNGYNLGQPAQFDQRAFSKAPANPAWRQSHPNGLTERELEALSSSSLAMWQNSNGSRVETDQSNVAQSPNKATFSTRLARFFHPGT
jgi:hypothetical protein